MERMRFVVLFLPLVLLPDASPRRRIDYARFELLGTHESWHTRHVSPAGNLFAVLNGPKIRLVDPVVGREARVLQGHAAMVHDLGWSLNGRFLGSTAFDGEVVVWEVETGRALMKLRPHPGFACSVAVSPDGSRLATGGSEDNKVRFYEIPSGKEIASGSSDGGPTYSLVWSGDGRQLFTHHADDSVRSWRSSDAAALGVFPRVKYQSHALASSADGRWFAYPLPDGAIILRECAGGKEVRRLPGHVGGTAQMVFDPFSRSLASSGADGALRFWDIPSGRLLASLSIPLGEDARLGFRDEGRRLVATGTGGVKILGTGK
jgi:WD40 repeat protein